MTERPSPEILQAEAQAKARTKALMAQTTREWMDIYIELLESSLRNAEASAGVGALTEAYREYATVVRPRLRRIAARLDQAGLALTDEIDLEGLSFEPPNNISWDNPVMPQTVLIWPDGQRITFKGNEATSCAAFLMWWQSMQAGHFTEQGLIHSITSPGEARILSPGDEGYAEYLKAKRQDIQDGRELGSLG